MKKYLLLLTVTIICLTSCGDDTISFNSNEIIGTWEQTKKVYIYQKDGSKGIKPASIFDNRWRRKFSKDEEILFEGRKDKSGVFKFRVFQKFRYEISNNKLITFDKTKNHEQEIIKLNDKELVLKDIVEFKGEGKVERTYFYEKID